VTNFCIICFFWDLRYAHKMFIKTVSVNVNNARTSVINTNLCTFLRKVIQAPLSIGLSSILLPKGTRKLLLE
jgi:hypothetical protein